MIYEIILNNIILKNLKYNLIFLVENIKYCIKSKNMMNIKMNIYIENNYKI